MVAIGSLGTRILSAANAIAPVAGAASGWLQAPMTVGGGISGAPNFIIQRLKGFKIANPVITTEIALSHEDQYGIMGAVVSAITGMAIREVGQAVGVGAVSSMGSALAKFGGSKAVNSVIAAWVYEAVNNPHGGVAGGPASGVGGAYVSAPTRSTNTVDVDNPQGLVPLYSGTAPDYR